MVTLRDYSESDLGRLVEIANNENVARYLTDTFPFPYTVDDAKWWIDTGSKVGVVKVIESDGMFVGSVGMAPRENEHRYSGVVGYWLGEEYWGRGIASVAVEMLTKSVFESTDIVRLSASVFSPNKPSRRVLEKAGYQHEATLSKSIYKNGEFYDEFIYTTIKSADL